MAVIRALRRWSVSGLRRRVQAGGDPCAALQLLLWLQPGETKEVTFLLGQGADRADTERLISHFHNIQNVEAAWQSVGEFWDEILEQTQVQTPDPGMDILLNRWLLYQSLSCRFWGRTAFYQSSGAYGFRDQLQDVNGLDPCAARVGARAYSGGGQSSV